MRKSQIYLLAACAFASALPLRVIDPALPAIALDLDVSTQAVAWLNSGYALPYALMLLVLGPLCDMTGRRVMIIFSLATLGAGLIISASAPGYWTLLASRMLVGGFAGAIIPAAMAYIGDRVELADRQVALSRVLMFSIFGQLAGALLSGLLADLVSWRATFLVTAVVALVILVTAWHRLDRDTGTGARLGKGALVDGYRRVLRNPLSWRVFVIVLTEGILIFGLFPFVAPVLEVDAQAGSVSAGVVLAAFGVGGLLYGTLAPTMVKRIPQRRLLPLGAVLTSAGYISGAFAAGNWPLMGMLFLVAGFGFYTFHNVIQMHATELAPAVRGAAMALFASAFFLGQALGPVIAGGVFSVAGGHVLFLVNGSLVLLLGLFAAHRLRRYE